MAERNRLNKGGRIERSQSMTFSFNGKSYIGYNGDTIASALLANGVDVVGRSFKYSRPRGILAAGAEEPNAILQVGSTDSTTIPNIRATQAELYQGLIASSVSGWPSLDLDVMAGLGRVGGAMMPPGFYYKTFMQPQSLWPTYEKYIRKAAGLGKVPANEDPDQYDKFNHHSDVLIIGGGPAGLAAARTLVGSGLRVIILDEQNEFGGSLLSSSVLLGGKPCMDWVSETLSMLSCEPNFTLLTRTTAFGYYDHNFIGAVERCTDHLGENMPGVRQRLHRIRAKKVILATGALERPLVFGNNDVPGCMLASAVSTYIHRYAVVPGNKLVLMTTNDHAYQTAIDWHSKGREVVAIIDTRRESRGDLPAKARDLGITVLTGMAVIDVKGNRRVNGVEVASINHDGSELISQAKVHHLACDTVASSGGWSPVVHLSCHTGSKPIWNSDIAGFVPGAPSQNQLYVGGIVGTYSLAAVLVEGAGAGLISGEELGGELIEDNFAVPTVDGYVESDSMELYHIPHLKPTSRAPKQFVDFQNDVTAAGIELATREGFESIEHVKRYTAMGFGTDQGKTSNINGMAIVAKALNQSVPETGTTIFRPMYTPVTFGALAGRDTGKLFDPARFTAMHEWHVVNGAKFEDVGQWKRPWYFPKQGETMQETLNRECMATRHSVGILDASTLGKIDIQGKDAREFLNRIYTNPWSKLAPGRCRYGVMCKEDGMIFDDGVTSCINDNHFIMTTTSGGAAAVLEWMELWHQTEWPELDVYFTSVTDHWATMTISGPNSRLLLEKLVDGHDLSNESFPYMSWQSLRVAGVNARVFRISFTGELSFETNVPANYGLYVWEQVMAAGEEFGITPYGTETMHVLRAEKGFIIAGQDTDGSVSPQDMDMNWIVGKNKEFSYIGKRSWGREDNQRQDRKQFVGLLTTDPSCVLPEGAQAVFDPNEPIPMTMVGHVTSSYFSPVLDRSIALGVIKGGLSLQGEKVYFPLPDGTSVEAEIATSVFYDPKGERQNV
ncbi:sarcosine oxidase subunit alpha family protein [Vibrio pectenicida]|uniref:Sarcosine oxidase subunit alpha family protein n=1 Tax=Vibrio pectenicida TaxID=62763 RepID=A0A7Y3ZXE4_9VIBR|nr:sarcosine oxidase subunit alpha family protein [Vibrio pectenicida]NOH70663.1 sarcosine oxidase subunit alpha family protein [Vibrio pectenicida]